MVKAKASVTQAPASVRQQKYRNKTEVKLKLAEAQRLRRLRNKKGGNRAELDRDIKRRLLSRVRKELNRAFIPRVEEERLRAKASVVSMLRVHGLAHIAVPKHLHCVVDRILSLGEEESKQGTFLFKRAESSKRKNHRYVHVQYSPHTTISRCVMLSGFGSIRMNSRTKRAARSAVQPELPAQHSIASISSLLHVCGPAARAAARYSPSSQKRKKVRPELHVCVNFLVNTSPSRVHLGIVPSENHR